MQAMQQGYWVIIPAAGSGNRFSQEKPKQYWSLHGKTILEHTIELFLEQAWVNRVIVAVAETDGYFKKLVVARHPKVFNVPGGQQRAHSVLNALNHLHRIAKPSDWVLVHDAVRPCLDKRDLYSLLQLRDEQVGGILAAPATDTLKKVNEQNEIQQTINREEIWLAQTPQMFRFQLLKNALAKAHETQQTITDEASAIEYLGYHPRVIRAQFPNPKLTFATELSYFDSLLETKLMKDAFA